MEGTLTYLTLLFRLFAFCFARLFLFFSFLLDLFSIFFLIEECIFLFFYKSPRQKLRHIILFPYTYTYTSTPLRLLLLLSIMPTPRQ